MAKRENPYEAAFEEFLRGRGIPYVAVDEQRRSLLAGDASLKSLDFLVSTSQGETWLVDVKGRLFPSGSRKQYWKNWSTRDDLSSLAQWERVFGQRSRGLFVFAYRVLGELAPLPEEELFAFRGDLYAFVGIAAADYARHARPLSRRWDTVSMPTARFRELAASLNGML